MQPSVCLLFLLLLSFTPTPVEPHLRVFNLRATDLPADILGITDGYVKVYVNGIFLGQTSVISNRVNPVWEEEFELMFVKETDVLRVEVHDSDFLHDDLVGSCQGLIQYGVHQRMCELQEGGQLFYTYTLTESRSVESKSAI